MKCASLMRPSGDSMRDVVQTPRDATRRRDPARQGRTEGVGTTTKVPSARGGHSVTAVPHTVPLPPRH